MLRQCQASTGPLTTGYNMVPDTLSPHLVYMYSSSCPVLLSFLLSLLFTYQLVFRRSRTVGWARSRLSCPSVTPLVFPVSPPRADTSACLLVSAPVATLLSAFRLRADASAPPSTHLSVSASVLTLLTSLPPISPCPPPHSSPCNLRGLISEVCKPF